MIAKFYDYDSKSNHYIKIGDFSSLAEYEIHNSRN